MTRNKIETSVADCNTARTDRQTVLRVLMVEDSADDCELICRQLALCGYTPLVERVFGEETMRNALEGGRWDIVFADYKLPGFCVRAALGLVRKMAAKIPVLCITGSADPIVITRILEAGADACINKDDLSMLCATVERVLAPEGATENQPNQPSIAVPPRSVDAESTQTNFRAACNCERSLP
ncbi:MAG: response regulator [Verrucomicrobiales bacterium]|nr:response regulator [Verrucomicrobiales bacterium]